MMKPHEEEWEWNGRWIEMAKAPVQESRKSRPASDSGKVTIARHEGEGGIERARLASKAPKMANLLARILDEHRAYMPYTAGDIEAVLREAGVLE